MKRVSASRQPSIHSTLGQFWGRRVAERRAQLGITQEDLARLTGVTQQTISKIESGAMIPLDRLKVVLAFRLGTRPDVLFAWPEMATDFEIQLRNGAVAS